MNIRPPVYYHLVQRYPIPMESWCISLASTCLLFVSLNAMIFVEIMKKVIDKYLIENAGNRPHKSTLITGLNVSILFLVVLEVCNVTAFGRFLLLQGEIKQRDKTMLGLSFIFYLFCEGCLAPFIVIFSNENLKQCFYSKFLKRFTFASEKIPIIMLPIITANKVYPAPYIVCKE